MSAKNLGRGLNALLGDDDNETVYVPSSGETVNTVSLSSLEPSPFQPRRVFDENAINDLVESIKTKGVLQPLLVRRKSGDADKYEIIGGERRWRASQMAGLKEVPVLVKSFSDKEALEVALIENLQRQDLNPLEEAEGYRRLMDEFSNTQEDLAKAVGKSRSHVANMMRLLGLPDKVKESLEQGKLTSGHARALLNAKNPEQLAEIVISKGLNVRQTEKLAQGAGEKKPRASTVRKNEKQDEWDQLAADLAKTLGINVVIKPKARGGELILTYSNLEELDDLLRRLGEKKTVENQSVVSKPESNVSTSENEDVISFSEEWTDMPNDDDVISLDKLEGNNG